MARKEKDAPEAEDPGRVEGPEEPANEPIEEADGYRPSRRQERQAKKEAEARKAQAEKEREEKKPAGAVDSFMEQHWEAWLRPVLLLLLLGGGVVAYRWDVIPETITGLIAAGGVVVATIYMTAWPAWDLIQTDRNRYLFGALVALWAFTGVPALRKAVPRPVLGEAVLTEQKKTATITAAEGKTGPYDLTASGKILPSGNQNVEATYEVVISGGGGSQTIEGSLEYSVHSTRTRRGQSHWTEKHDRVEHRLSRAIVGPEVTFTTERIDELFQDGLHLLLHPRDPILPILMPEIGGVQVPVLGILVVLLMVFVETRIGDAKNKPYLVMASATTLVFIWRFTQRATSANLVPPAVEALFVALILGGMGGSFVGWLARRWSGRGRLKPLKADKDDR